MIKEFRVSTEKRYQLIDITEKVEQIIDQAGLEQGQILIFLPHSTAGILLTENEEGLKQDWLNLLKKIISGTDFLHNRIDNNADAHLLSGLIGQGKNLPIENGQLIRGTWQNIFLAEFDGPRTRKIIISF